MFLLRHGQSEFNLHFTRTRSDPGIEDPRLTPEGHAQARAAGLAMAGAGIRRILVSPYTRALQTATEVAAMIGAPIEIDVLVRERFAFACDVGTARSVLAQAWPAHDFGEVDEVWWPAVRESDEDVLARAAAFRTTMQGAADADRVLLVSHWGFLLALTGRSIQNGDWLEWDPHAAAPTSLSYS